MDPLERLPLEIVYYIWEMLDKQDLLSCLVVNRYWLEITQNVKKWRQYCDANELNHAASWYEVFLNECKLKWPWKVGSFNDGVVIDDCKLFCCSEAYIYIVDINNRLIKYHPSGEILKYINGPDNCRKMYLINNDIALISDRIHYYEIIIFNADLEELYRFESAIDETHNSGGRFWFRSAENNNIIIIYYAKTYKSERRIERLEVNKGTTLTPIDNGWSSLYHGVVEIISGDSRERIYKCDETPMSRIFMTIFSNDKDIIVVIDKKIIAGKHTYCTIIIYRNHKKLFRVDIPKQLRYWCFSGDFLVFASLKDISTIRLTDGNLWIGNEILSFNYSDYIYGIQNLFKNHHIAYIIVDRCAFFTIFDVKKQYNLIRIDCDRTPNIITANKLDTLVCVSKMFAYCLNDKNKIEVKKVKI